MKPAVPSRVIGAVLFAAVLPAGLSGLVVSACSSDDPGGRSSSGVFIPDDAGGTTETGAGDSSRPSRPELCEGLELGGQVVPEVARRGEPPPPLGGTIGPGTYDLSGLEVYGQAPDAGSGEFDGGDEPSGSSLTGKAGRATIVVSDSYMRFIDSRGTADSLGPSSVRTLVNRTDGTSIVGSQLCPTSAPGRSLPFSAVGTGLAIFPDANHRELYIRR